MFCTKTYLSHISELVSWNLHCPLKYLPRIEQLAILIFVITKSFASSIAFPPKILPEHLPFSGEQWTHDCRKRSRQITTAITIKSNTREYHTYLLMDWLMWQSCWPQKKNEYHMWNGYCCHKLWQRGIFKQLQSQYTVCNVANWVIVTISMRTLYIKHTNSTSN